MNNVINELRIYSNNALDLLKDFVFDLGVECIEEEKDCFVIRDSENLDNLEFAIKIYCEKLAIATNQSIDLQIKKSTISSIDWIEEYKKNVAPIEVGRFYIHPSWIKPKDNKINLLIEPSLAFGSGHHESTNMMLTHIDKLVNSDMLCADVGCGSGILSIAMASLGASVVSCDIDEQAIIATKDNAKNNNVVLSEIYQGSIKGIKKFDLICANIIAEVIINLKDELRDALKDNGILIISGIIDKYIDKIKHIFSNDGFVILSVMPKNEWYSLVLQRRDDI